MAKESNHASDLSIETLVATLRKESSAHIKSAAEGTRESSMGDAGHLNPPTSHPSGGEPDDVINTQTGERFKEHQDDLEEKIPSAVGANSVKTKDSPEGDPQQPTVGSTGKNPDVERKLKDKPTVNETTSHPANNDFEAKYAMDRAIAENVASVQQMNEAMNALLHKLNSDDDEDAGEGQTKEAQNSAPAEGASNGGENKEAAAAGAQTNDDIPECLRGKLAADDPRRESLQGLTDEDLTAITQNVYQKLAFDIYDTRSAAHSLADYFDLQKKAAAEQAETSKKVEADNKQAAKTATDLVNDIQARLQKIAMGEMGGAPVEAGAIPAPASAGDPAVDPAAGGAGSEEEELAAMLPMLEQLAEQHGVPVEAIIEMALADMAGGGAEGGMPEEGGAAPAEEAAAPAGDGEGEFSEEQVKAAADYLLEVGIRSFTKSAESLAKNNKLSERARKAAADIAKRGQRR